jgi:hypothetical protein
MKAILKEWLPAALVLGGCLAFVAKAKGWV